MNGNPTVAAVIARDLAVRRAALLRAPWHRQFQDSHALVDAGVELISARHEGNAASMADAYAKATGELTLVSVHSGPGLTNAITGIAEAAKSRTPLLVLAGDVPNGAVKTIFISSRPNWCARSAPCRNACIRRLGARGCAARGHSRVARPSDRRAVACRSTCRTRRWRPTAAARTAAGAGPHCIPIRGCGAGLPMRCSPRQTSAHPRADAARCCRTPKGRSLALADRTGALLATTVCGHGLFAGSPWSLGICGGFSSPIADELISRQRPRSGLRRQLHVSGRPSAAS